MEQLAPLILAFGVLFVWALIGSAKARALEDARKTYQASLEALRRSPTDAKLRQRTLELGREYSNLARKRKGVTIFDEVALMNDISAAVGSAALLTSPPSFLAPTTGASDARGSIEERLARLQSLRDRGHLSEEELQQRRREIVAEI